jgi:Ser/Thr protein kinase RdoA (MazF antagonist)
MIGRIVKLSDGSFFIGELPGIGGPFKTAAEFFCAWAKYSRFPFDEEFIRARTPKTAVDEIISSIKNFPARLSDFAQHYTFRSGPFPLMHSDLYSSNVLVDSECCIKGVIDWENAIVGPWKCSSS